MSCQIKRTKRALQNIRALPNPLVGQAVAALVDEIARDPIQMTNGITQGTRVYDRMILPAGVPYYVQIHFVHNADANEVTIMHVKAMLSSGPH